MKGTFYGHFVAGEMKEEIKPKIDLMEKFGVGAILDYAVEADMPSSTVVEAAVPSVLPKGDQTGAVLDIADVEKRFKFQRKFADRRKDLYSARTYIYEGEEKCDQNRDVFLDCIETTGKTSHNGFAAIKITALGRPHLLLRLSEILNQTTYFFDKLASKSGFLNERSIANSTFYKGLQDLGIDMSESEAAKIFDLIDENKSGHIDVIEWHNFLTPQLQLSKLFRAKPKTVGDASTPLLTTLTDAELQEMHNLQDRLMQIAELAKERGVTLMIDAEQSYFQPAISRLTLDCQRTLNKERPVVFNTYQCYLKGAQDTVLVDLELAKRENFYFGAKLVRGAYMEQERARAATVGYDDPIHPNYEATNNSYNTVIDCIMKAVAERGASVMIASHNEESVRLTVDKMKKYAIEPRAGKVFFGQLLGMCDGISYALGQAGFSAYKYVPYGPVIEVLPYLSRRAVENRGLLRGIVKERQMLWDELKRRVREGDMKHNPYLFVR
ncbi:proline dehydrogenase 1, mitochondrial-like isoform X2 [Rhopilema esculentum]